MIKLDYPSTCSRIGPAVACLTVLVPTLTGASLTRGTGGSYDAADQNVIALIEQYRGSIELPMPNEQKEVVVAPSAVELLTNIRDVFGLKMSEVAQIFGISRRAAYDWLGGAVPKPDLMIRLYNLSKQADDFKAVGIERIEHFLYRPVAGERSLLDLLKSGENIETALVVIKNTAAEEAFNRKISSRRVLDNTAKADGFDEVSTPIFD